MSSSSSSAGRAGNRRLAARFNQIRGDESNEGRRRRARRNRGREALGEWNHPIVGLTEDDVQRRIMLQSTILSESSLKSYSCLLAKFVCFVAETDPFLLTDDLRLNIQGLPPNQWKRFAKDYYLTKPKPPSSMLKLDEISPSFVDWVSSMKKSDGESDMSSSTYNSCRSAVISLFTLFGVSSERFDREASQIIRALKIVHSSTAHEGIIRPQKGKTPLSFENYCDLAKALMKSKDSSAVFSHAVLTTMWNLMSRVGNAVSICKNHMEWRDDALLIYFAHEKTDQTQSRPGDPRHIYANPYQPAICPILSLGVFFLITDITSRADQHIFSGSNQYCRFHKSLKSRFADELSLGCSVAAYGTHSIRKGAATFVSSGTTSCPSFAAISLRAGWSMGGVTSAYIHYHAAGDQHVGRTVCGLNPLHPSFAVLPPQFVPDYDPKPLLRVLFSGFDSETPEFQKVLSMTTASVIYHMEWLKDHLEDAHPLFSTDLFRMVVDRPFSETVESRVWKPGDVMRATGIPPHYLTRLKYQNPRKKNA